MKRSTLISNAKFVDNMTERDRAIGLAKEFERILQRVSNGGDLHELPLHERWQRARRQLAQLVGARPRINLTEEQQ